MAKRGAPERQVQVSIVNWLRVVMPQAVVIHVANEHFKRGTAGILAANRQKAMGALTGAPDLIVLPFANVGAFFLEVKAEGNYATPAQKEVHAKLRHLGYHVAVVRSIDDVRECLQEWGIGFQEITG